MSTKKEERKKRNKSPLNVMAAVNNRYCKKAFLGLQRR